MIFLHVESFSNVSIDIFKKEIKHKRIVKKEFNRDTVEYYDDNYSSPGLKKFYIVNNVLENFTSKMGQHIEILELEQFGKSLFIDNEIQVAESDEHLYSSTFVNSGLKLNSDKNKSAIIGVVMEELQENVSIKVSIILIGMNLIKK